MLSKNWKAGGRAAAPKHVAPTRCCHLARKMSNSREEFTREVSPHQPPKACYSFPRVEEGIRQKSPPGEKLQRNELTFRIKGFRMVPGTE